MKIRVNKRKRSHSPDIYFFFQIYVKLHHDFFHIGLTLLFFWHHFPYIQSYTKSYQDF